MVAPFVDATMERADIPRALPGRGPTAARGRGERSQKLWTAC
jgi:hypothetical protein